MSQKKNPKRVNIFLDGEFAFGISVETKFIKKLEVGKSLTDSQVGKLIEQDQICNLLNKSFKFLSYRPRSEKEVRDYLLGKGKLNGIKKSNQESEQYEKSVEEVINKLKKLKQVDDKEFANWLLWQRKKFRQWGDRLIKMELLQKGIDKDLVDKLLSESEGVSEEDLALKAAEKKIRTFRNLDGKEFKIKLDQFLSRKGFDWDIIKKVVDTLEQKELK